MDLGDAAFGSEVAVAALAGAAALRRRNLWGAASLFGVAVATDVARRAIWVHWIAPKMAVFVEQGTRPPPLTGWLRVAGHVDQALFLLWPAGVAALAVGVLMARPRAALAVGAGLWAPSVAVFAGAYPWLRFERQAAALQIVHVTCLSAALFALAFWMRRRVPRALERGPYATEVVTVLTIALDALVAFRAYADRVANGWPIAQSVQLVLHIIVALILAGVLVWPQSGSRSRAMSRS